ncbi:desmocollin 2-like protein [Brachionichthys hirsutus]|uniref:desmocollin 2-like protein n=1 Tax=Brachionichthys hirsutus TaxID=412623 RepID=UPI0036053628
MAKDFIFSVCLLFLSCVESCEVPTFIDVYVPPAAVAAGYQVGKVEFDACDMSSVRLRSEDPAFKMTANGGIIALAAVAVGAAGRTFSVRVEGAIGVKRVEVRLIRAPVQGKQKTNEGILKRFKRRWSPPPFNILENDRGPYPRDIEELTSDSAAKHDVYYTFSGPGVDQHPVGVFSLNRDTGMLTVHKTVDREEFPSFTLITNVYDKRTNAKTDDSLPIVVIVDDVNDNAPTFKGSLQITTFEQSDAGTVVGKVNATDRDQEGTLHVKIRYTLLDGLDVFSINSETGVITTVTDSLDREVKDKYMVTVQIRDMDGAVTGLSNTGTATIALEDINDNPPTFTKALYEANVQENEADKLVLRIPVEDRDLINTPNWISKFIISKGDENGNFRIDTDPNTNDGLLYLTKPLNYEKTKNMDLEITARNVAELQGTKAQWQKIPVAIAVSNVDEGPEFTAPIVHFNVKENTPNGTLIGTYTAVDPETKSSKGITYYKVTDPASWVNVDKNTGELRVANTIDRESHLVHDGTYNVTMKAVDASSKSGTGTVIIVVEDVNDNMPKLPTSELVLCEDAGSVLVVAEDNDQSPFSSPFIFSLPQDHDGKWAVTKYNDTAATLTHVKDLHNGIYEVPIDVKDLQGFGEKQSVKVKVCECRNGACLAKDSSSSLGPLALLAMLLPLALLLLLALLLIFFCVTKREKMQFDDVADSGGILLKSNTEAPGEAVDSSLIIVPTLGLGSGVKDSFKGSMVNTGWQGNKSSNAMGVIDDGVYQPGFVTNNMQDYYSNQFDTQQFNGGQLVGSGLDFDSRYLAQNSGFHHRWQTNGRYLQQKLVSLGTEDERYADDIIHGYKFEGVGSAAGSIGCCSNHGDSDNLDFLNTLGPKFKTLGEVCKKT